MRTDANDRRRVHGITLSNFTCVYVRVFRLSPRVTKPSHSMSKSPSNMTSPKDPKNHIDADLDCWKNHHVDSRSKQHPQEWADERLLDRCGANA